MELDHSSADTASKATTAKMESNNRRPMNAFLLFCKRHRAIVKEVYPNLENRHITKILGEFWGSLSQEEKLPFNDLAASYKDHLMREQPNLIKRPLPKSENQHPALDHEEKSDVKSGQGSSGSSSPEPGSSSCSAPKHFKKRFLAMAEKAKIGSESSERKSACEALLKLAEGSQGGSSSDKSKESTTTTNGSSKSNPYDKVKESAQFTVLRQAVWTRVAKTILTQEEEKGKVSNSHDDKPINLSSQCLIPNSTIIEHIIENIINDDTTESAKSNETASIGSTECSEQIKEKIYQSLKEDITRRTVGGAKDGSNDLTALWKMLPNPMGGVASTKKNGVQTGAAADPQNNQLSVKKAHSAPASQSGSGAPSPKGCSSSSEPAVSVTLVTTESDLPLNLSKTPPQTPSSASLSTGIAITITTSSPAKRKLLDDEMDDDLRRSSRACKGRRYQEFKDAVGRRGSRGKAYMGKSDGESSQHSEDEQMNRPHVEAKEAKVILPPSAMTTSAAPLASFDLEKALMSIPALRPEEFQRRIQMSRQQQRSSATHMSSPRSDTAMDTTDPVNSRRTKSAARLPSETTLVVSAHGH